MKLPPPQRRRRWRLTAGLTLIVALVVAIPVYALGASTFDAEDGNLVVDGNETDWANAPNLRFGDDKPTGQTDDSLGNGTKEDDAVPSVIDGSIPNNKSDLTRFYVASENVERPRLPLSRLGAGPGSDRARPTWTSSSISPAPSAATASPRCGPRATCWSSTTSPRAAPSRPSACIVGSRRATPRRTVEASAKLPCWGKVKPLGTDAVGSVNTAAVTDPIKGVSLSPRTFGEAAIDLTAAGILDPTKCQSFGKAYLKSRSSDSFTAAVKDFIAPINVEHQQLQARHDRAGQGRSRTVLRSPARCSSSTATTTASPGCRRPPPARPRPTPRSATAPRRCPAPSAASPASLPPAPTSAMRRRRRTATTARRTSR